MITWKRSLRTPSSERFLAVRNGAEVAAVDLHYLPSGHASGTVILLNSAGWKDEDISPLLSSLDEDLLPDVDLTQGTLTYTVVKGEVVGNYEASSSSSDS
ncbi:MAG TPA: hypothetical protein VFW05_03185 [Verrucomicrobiae bacterium]|jgi:hypothetical protein|nr:hypothetical protein [Verrucomicrobiae bacterium]